MNPIQHPWPYRRFASVGGLTLLLFASAACSGDDDEKSKDDDSTATKKVERDDDPSSDERAGEEQPGDEPAAIDGEEAAAAPFGAGESEVGTAEADESEPLGPSSFAVSEDGTIHLLDVVNGRIQVLRDGKREGEIPVPSPGVDDIALLPDGRLLVLDRFVEKKVFVIDRKGAIESEVAIAGIGLPETGAVSGMLVRPDGVWLRGDRRIVRVLDARQRPDAKRPILPANLSRDGKLLISTSIAGSSLSVIVRERDGLPKNRVATFELDEHISHVLGHELDASGRHYIATLHITGKGDDRKVSAFLLVLSAELDLVRKVDLKPAETAHEVFRYLDVTASGKVYYLELTSEGAVVRRYQ